MSTPTAKPRWALSALGAAAVVLALVFPGNALHALRLALAAAALGSGIASYGLFAAAARHAWFMNRTEDSIRRRRFHSGLPLLTIERLNLWAVKIFSRIPGVRPLAMRVGRPAAPALFSGLELAHHAPRPEPRGVSPAARSMPALMDSTWCTGGRRHVPGS